MVNSIKEHGFSAVPRDAKSLFSGKYNHKPVPVEIEDIPFPSTELVKKVQEYAKAKLRTETYNHSMRVYYYGQAIVKQQFPEWTVSNETYALTCLLHDIGTTPENLKRTLLSFEFYGGLLALKLISEDLHAPMEQGEAVAEAIIRHQDLGERGKITTLGQLIQLATIFDNMGLHPELVHHDTIKNVTDHFPRQKWSSCFAATIRQENSMKPWAHTTALGEEEFPSGVLSNKLMEPFDG